MLELMQCPFCGSPAEARFIRHGLIAGNGFQGICCTVCSATVKERSQYKSIERWNARAKLVENVDTTHNSESTPLQGPYCSCGNQGGSVELCAMCGRVVR